VANGSPQQSLRLVVRLISITQASVSVAGGRSAQKSVARAPAHVAATVRYVEVEANDDMGEKGMENMPVASTQHLCGRPQITQQFQV
jgi:hypothetical protein